jgi:HK97 family phage prohead protease
METVYKTYRAEVKGVNVETGEVDMFIPVSTMSVDRDGEIVEPNAFKKTLPKFMKRPVLVASHDYKDLTNQIGEWSRLKIGDTGMDGKPKYYINEGNDQADWGFKLASKGMAAFSIGFIPTVWEDGDGTAKSPRRTYKEVELLEISQVIVPSNREAIQSVRSKGVDAVTDALYGEVEKELDNLVTKPEETANYIHIPVKTCKITATIDISVKEGIKALYCGKEKEIATYLFAKDKGWTMAKARQWVKDHSKEYVIGETSNSESDEIIIMAVKAPENIQVLAEHEVSQEEIIDEMDYLGNLITTEGISEKARADVWVLVEQLMRLAGDDIPDEIKKMFTVEVIKYIPETKETLNNTDILDAIKRVAKHNVEVK